MNALRNRFLLAGVGLIVLANAAALGGVLYNRSGPIDASLRLTQRELQVPAIPLREAENTGLALALQWQVQDSCNTKYDRYGMSHIAAWLDEDRLKALGVRIARRPVGDGVLPGSVESLPVEVFVALELDGPAYAKQVEHACGDTGNSDREDDRRAACTGQRDKASRLVLVDAGLDPEELRARHPDRSMYAIVRAQVRAIGSYGSCTGKVVGLVSGLANSEITVPLSLRRHFEPEPAGGIAKARAADAPFEALVHFGRLREPWLEELR